MPPFCRPWRTASSKVTIRLVDTGETLNVRYKSYPLVVGNAFYATVRIKGLTYIVRPLPRGWKRGDTTDVRGHFYSWFVWQGPDYEFREPLFDGPVGRSAGPPAGKRRKRRESQAAPAADALLSQDPPNSPRQGSISSEGDSSLPVFEDSPDSNQGSSSTAPRQDAIRVTFLTPSQEYSTTLHIKIHKDRETYFSLHLSSARPRTDPNGAVTNESLFEKITRTANRVSPSPCEIQVLEAIFHAGLLDVTEASDNSSSGDWPDLEPLMIIRGEEDTFECFQSHVLAFNKLNAKVSWFVDLRVIAE